MSWKTKLLLVVTLVVAVAALVVASVALWRAEARPERVVQTKVE